MIAESNLCPLIGGRYGTLCLIEASECDPCGMTRLQAGRREGGPGDGPYRLRRDQGAIDNAELGNLTGLLEKIKPALSATIYSGERTAKNYGFVDAVASKNVELNIADIRKRSPVLAELESANAIRIAGAMYNLETGAVDFYPLRS